MSDDERPPGTDQDDPDGSGGGAPDDRASGGERGGADAGGTDDGADAREADGEADAADDAGGTSSGSAGETSSAPGTAPWMASGTAAAEETTLADIAAQEEVPEGTPSIGYLPSLPESFVSLGAGCLAAATLLSFGAFAFVIWMRVTGNVRDLMPWEVTLAAILMAVSTVFLAGGTYFARKRVRWTLTMLAALVGSFAVLTIPFTAVAVVCIGLTRVHFTAPFVDDVSPDEAAPEGPGAEE